MTRLALAATCLATLALVATGCGDDEEAVSGPAALIPANAPLYFEAVIRPDEDQSAAIDSLVGRLGELPIVGRVADPGDLIKEAIEDSAAQAGIDLSFEEDIDPWLGRRLAVGYLSVEDGSERFIAALETTDDAAARDGLERILEADAAANEERSYEGVTYYTSGTGGYAVGVFAGHLVLTTLDEFETAVDASGGDENLAADERLDETLGALSEGRLATLYADLGRIGPLIEADSAEDAEEFARAQEAIPELLGEPIALAAGIAENQVYLEILSPLLDGQPETGESPLLAAAPGDAIAAVAAQDVGQFAAAFAGLYDRLAESGVELEGYPPEGAGAAFEEETGVPFDDAVAAFGDGSFWIRGKLPDQPELGVEVEVADGATAQSLLDYMEEESREDGDAIGPPLDRSADGFSADLTESSPSEDLKFINVELSDELLSLRFYPDRSVAARSEPPERQFGASAAYELADAALGEEFELIGVADLGPILESVLGSTPSPESVGEAILGGSPEQLVLGFLADRLEVVAAGVRHEDGRVLQRLTLRIAD